MDTEKKKRENLQFWENWMATFGVACLAGAVISPASWPAGIAGILATGIAWWAHKRRVLL